MTKQDEKEVQVKLMNIFKKYNKITHKRMAEIARRYYNGLTKEEQTYILSHPQYRWSVKALRFPVYKTTSQV